MILYILALLARTINLFCDQSNTRGPREPWHDLHCKIEGPAAYDILTNFEQRWRKATKWSDFNIKKVTRWHDDALIKLDRISWILTPSSSPGGDKKAQVTDEEDPENWHVQVCSRFFFYYWIILSCICVSHSDGAYGNSDHCHSFL